MSRWMVFAVVVVVVVVVAVVELPGKVAAENNPEEQHLPKPSAWRQRPSVPSSPGNNPSYDLSEAYNAMAANRMGGNSKIGGGGGGAAGYDASSMGGSPTNHYESYTAQSDYGSYPSESGYGLSCASGYVNASAVALLAFLFLLNIVQDVVQQITGARKRRSVEEDEQEDVFAFVSNGGLGAMKEGLPQVVLPLMIDLLDATEGPHECFQRPLCEANAELSTRFGVAGRMVGSLLSNVVSKAFSGDHTPKFHLGLQASSAGRSGHDCSTIFKKCYPGNKYTQEANANASRKEDSDSRPHDNFL